MKVSLFLLEIISVALALTPHAIPGFDTKNDLVKRIDFDEIGKGEPVLRPHPVLGNVPSRDNNLGGPSVPEVAGTKPEFPYQDEPIAQDVTGKDDPTIGESVYVSSIHAIPAWAKLYLGLNDEEYAKAMAGDGWLTAALNGREYTARSSPEESYNRQRAIGKKEYSNAAAAAGLGRGLPETWDKDKGWWQGVAVDLEDSVAMKRYRLVTRVTQKILGSPQGLRLRIVDNTGSGKTSRPALKGRGADSQDPPYGLPPTPVDGGPLGQTLLEDTYPVQGSKRSKLSERQNPVNQITDQETGATLDVANNTNDLSAEYQTYLAAFRAAQSNVSALIFPFLDTMLNGTNSSIVYNAAWSIYSDLTGSSPIIVGPFMYGMHSLDWIEDQIFGVNPNVSAMSDDDKFARDKILAFHSVLLDLYYYAWDGAVAAINETGLLDDMTRLAGYLSTNDTSVMGAYAHYKSPAYDTNYFTIYNATVLPDSAYGNLSS